MNTTNTAALVLSLDIRTALACVEGMARAKDIFSVLNTKIVTCDIGNVFVKRQFVKAYLAHRETVKGGLLTRAAAEQMLSFAMSYQYDLFGQKVAVLDETAVLNLIEAAIAYVKRDGTVVCKLPIGEGIPSASNLAYRRGF